MGLARSPDPSSGGEGTHFLHPTPVGALDALTNAPSSALGLSTFLPLKLKFGYTLGVIRLLQLGLVDHKRNVLIENKT